MPPVSCGDDSLPEADVVDGWEADAGRKWPPPEGREVVSAGDLRGGGCAEQQASVVKEALGIGISRENRLAFIMGKRG
jgi:hypothetical protein